MAQYKLPVVWSPNTRHHDPRHEVWVGVATPATEVAQRVDAILDALTEHGARVVEATPHDDEVLARVHDAGFRDFLATAAERWARGPYDELVGQDRVVPYLFPTPAMTGEIASRPASVIHASAGTYCYDTMTLVGPGTWTAARAAVDCVLTAVDLVLAGERAAYALTRPPGHHATAAGYGGSCYLNNAAVAAQALRTRYDSVGIVDLDAHHGNGTSAIFYGRSDVRYGSVHVDPGAGWFPHIVGYADEIGVGQGLGRNRNLPVPEGTTDERWLTEVGDLAEWVRDCEALVVSLGVDAAADDPESPLLITHDGYQAAGGILGALDLPCVVVQEGGYHLPTLGRLVLAYLRGHTAS